MPLMPAFRKQKQEGSCEFKASQEHTRPSQKGRGVDSPEVTQLVWLSLTSLTPLLMVLKDTSEVGISKLEQSGWQNSAGAQEGLLQEVL